MIVSVAVVAVLYLSIMAFTFVFIPFAYFYYEENDEDATFKDRVIGGCKYTSFLIVILIVLIIIGALIKSHKPDVMFDPTNAKSLEAWADSLFSKSPGDFVITFGLSCLTLLGFLVLITYTVTIALCFSMLSSFAQGQALRRVYCRTRACVRFCCVRRTAWRRCRST
jgi:heme/copper-type cytochrome/quinol oxidase subunit 4